MRRCVGLFVVVLALTSCGETAAIPETDLLLRITIGTENVELGRAFAITVVRVWSQDLDVPAWDDDLLAPLALRVDATTRYEAGGRVMETHRFRAYAFTRKDVVIPAPRLVATAQDGSERLAVADTIRLRVRPALDPDERGTPEMPGGPIPEPTRAPPWLLLLAVLTGVVGWTLVRGRSPVAATEAPPPVQPAGPSAHDVAIERLRALRASAPQDTEAIRADVVAAADVLRAYVAAQLHVPALEQTTDELLTRVRVRSRPSDQRHLLAGVLREADFVKFAARVPDLAARDALLGRAEAFVEETGS